MRKIKLGNDFEFPWRITRGGEPVNLKDATLDLTLYINTIGRFPRKVPINLIDDNTLFVEITPKLADRVGVYILELKYIAPEPALSDGSRESSFDKKTFEIVATSEEADPDDELSFESDLLIALRGPKGDPLKFEDLTPEQKQQLGSVTVEFIDSKEYNEIII